MKTLDAPSKIQAHISCIEEKSASEDLVVIINDTDSGLDVNSEEIYEEKARAIREMMESHQNANEQ